MAKKTDSKIDKRSIARTLYLDGNYTQEEIAVKVGVSADHHPLGEGGQLGGA